MAELDVICWLWGQKYALSDVAKLANRVRKNLKREHRFHVFADLPYKDFPSFVQVHEIEDRSLMDRSCYCRLRMFDPAWQRRNGFERMIVSLDLDLVITGALDPIFSANDDFKILQGVNSMNPNPFNASIMQLKVGCHPQVWSTFGREKAKLDAPYFKFPDDQGWIWHKLPDAAGWKPGAQSGIYAFMKPGWPGGQGLPADARIVAFLGYRKPVQFAHVPWVQKYWASAA